MSMNELQAGLEAITGPMFSGKSQELIRRLGRMKYADIETLIIKPKSDTRESLEIVSRDGSKMSAIEVQSAKEILDVISKNHRVIGIDEAQFFDHDLIDVVLELVRNGRRVIVSGLDLTFDEKPFEPMASIIALASPVDKLTAICMKCHKREAVRSQRLSSSLDEIEVGDTDTYEARCLSCYEPPSRLNIEIPKLVEHRLTA